MHRNFLLVLALGFFAGSAWAPGITIVSPIPESTVVIGQPLVVDFNTDFNIHSVQGHLSIFNRIDNISIFNQAIGTSRGINRYRATIDTTGLVSGRARLTIQAFYIDANNSVRGTYNFMNLTILDANEVVDENGPVTVRRFVPSVLYPQATAGVSLVINPNSSFPGMVIRERIKPETIVNGTFAGSGNTINHNYDQNTGLLRIIIRKTPAITPVNITYYIVTQNLEPETPMEFDGNWTIEGASGQIIRPTTVRIGGFVIPQCPISDEQILSFIDRWSEGELSNSQLLQVVDRWSTC